MAETPASPGPEQQTKLRGLPSVEELAAGLNGATRSVAVAAARTEIERARARILAGEEVDGSLAGLQRAAGRRAAALERGSLVRVINATGVVLHTNLGRAPLAPEAIAAAARVSGGYSNLELRLAEGTRGSRHDHIEEPLRDLTDAEAAMAVNNNAAAVLLALAAVAAGGEVVISRGQLVEIGGSFRIPEIMELSGASLVEVGTTNRTRISDYVGAIGPRTAALLVVHQSNFRTVGFVEQVEVRDLARLAADRGIPLIDDLGSGAMAGIEDEPAVGERLRAGADVVCFSADKLLGGPQAGILAGRRDLIERCRRHPLARALRLDKLQLAALEATLRLHRDRGPESLPALAMLAADQAVLRRRAEVIAGPAGDAAAIERGEARPGGGSLPLSRLTGPVCAVDPGGMGADALAAGLRRGDPPVIARIERGKVILDPRTMTDEEAEIAGRAVRAALAGR
ncbi:MAG TPA: L-seryl-tRNA(Sec) selenium transferase [Solirubrobacterales bacterium]|jgi:L-seryl-tRNA(Ser) seleniumtransferase